MKALYGHVISLEIKSSTNDRVLCSTEVKLSPSIPWRPIGEVEVRLHSFSTSALDGGEWSNSWPGPRFTEEKNPGGTQGAFEHYGGEKSQATAENRTPDDPPRSLITTPVPVLRYIKQALCLSLTIWIPVKDVQLTINLVPYEPPTKQAPNQCSIVNNVSTECLNTAWRHFLFLHASWLCVTSLRRSLMRPSSQLQKHHTCYSSVSG